MSEPLSAGRALHTEPAAAEMARELNVKPASLRMALTRARKTAYQLLQDKADSEGAVHADMLPP
mgnify:CR=1 FL=1